MKINLPVPGLLLLVIFLNIHFDYGYTQDSTAIDSVYRYEELGLMFIPADWTRAMSSTDSAADKIVAEVADICTKAAVDVGRFYVADWLVVDDIIYEEDLAVPQRIDESQALQFAELAELDEVFLFEVIDFVQFGVPDDEEEDEGEEESFFLTLLIGLLKAVFANEGSVGDDDDPYPDNIRTVVEIEFNQIDVANAEVRQTFTLIAQHTGGNRDKSKTKALNDLGEKISDELRKIFLLTAKVKTFQTKNIILDLGAENGIRTGDMFEVLQSESRESQEGKEFIGAGKKIGLARVTAVDNESSKTELIRQWSAIDTGYQAVEFNKTVRGVTIHTAAPLLKNYISLGFEINWNPIFTWDYGGGLKILTKKDSFEDRDWGFGFGAYGGWRFLNMYKLSLRSRADMDLEIFFREDDLDDTVTLALFSVSAGLNSEFLLSKKTDLTIFLGYRFLGSSKNWQKNSEDEDENLEAYWDDQAPRINISGFFIRIGYRFLFY